MPHVKKDKSHRHDPLYAKIFRFISLSAENFEIINYLPEPAVNPLDIKTQTAALKLAKDNNMSPCARAWFVGTRDTIVHLKNIPLLNPDCIPDELEKLHLPASRMHNVRVELTQVEFNKRRDLAKNHLASLTTQT